MEMYNIARMCGGGGGRHESVARRVHFSPGRIYCDECGKYNDEGMIYGHTSLCGCRWQSLSSGAPHPVRYKSEHTGIPEKERKIPDRSSSSVCRARSLLFPSRTHTRPLPSMVCTTTPTTTSLCTTSSLSLLARLLASSSASTCKEYKSERRNPKLCQGHEDPGVRRLRVIVGKVHGGMSRIVVVGVSVCA